MTDKSELWTAAFAASFVQLRQRYGHRGHITDALIGDWARDHATAAVREATRFEAESTCTDYPTVRRSSCGQLWSVTPSDFRLPVWAWRPTPVDAGEACAPWPFLQQQLVQVTTYVLGDDFITTETFEPVAAPAHPSASCVRTQWLWREPGPVAGAMRYVGGCEDFVA